MRSDNLELRLQLRSTINRTLNELMYSNQISATDMEEALEHFLLSLKENVMMEYAEAAIQEKMILQQQLEELQTPAEESSEEE